MPIHSKTNLYPSINAHLNSFLQQEGGGWESFHTEHIIDLRRALDDVLPIGYYALAEKSLQITPLTWLGPQAARINELMLEEDDDYTGIVVYEYKVGEIPAKPVTRIELLSPTNKSPHRDYNQYNAKRQQTLESGISLVEIDYLHQTSPANPLVKNYSAGEESAYPYNITIDIPKSSFSAGEVEYYGVNVDGKLPTIRIPLHGSDSAALNLQDAYNRTCESGRFFFVTVDYAADPVNFDRYTPDDQSKIRAILEPIRRQHADE